MGLTKEAAANLVEGLKVSQMPEKSNAAMSAYVMLVTADGNVKMSLANLAKLVGGGGDTILNLSAVAENGVVSDRKRYIQGNDKLMNPFLHEYDDFRISDYNTIHVDDITVKIGDTYVQTEEKTLKLPTSEIGTNYYIVCDSEGAITIEMMKKDDDTHKTIGGFHFGRIRISRTVDNITSGIVPNSIWTLRWRPRCKNPDAMVYLGNNLWGDIYLTRSKTSAKDADGVGAAVHDSSAFGAMPATGSENYCQFTFTECLAKVGKRLSYSEEFVAAADGSPIGLDNANTNAWSATSNTSRTSCGNVANAISFYNVVDLVGNVWKWNADKYELNNGGTSYAWHEVSNVKGDVYGVPLF